LITLYIDGDAFPNILKPIIYRAIEKLELQTFVISNKRINIGLSNYINYVIVSDGADEADNRIVEMVNIWEWCSDWYDGKRNVKNQPQRGEIII